MRLKKAEKKMSLKFNIKDVIYTILFILYVTTFVTRVVDIPGWSSICLIIICVSDVFFITFFAKRRAFNKLIVFTSLFFGYFLFSTLFMCPDKFGLCLIRTIRRISFVLLISYLFSRYKAMRTITILMKVMEVLNYVNLFFMILYPNGMYHSVTGTLGDEVVKNTRDFVRTSSTRVHWLLGHQTTLIRYVLPALCVAVLYSYFVNNQGKLCFRSKVLIITCLAEVLIANSATNYIIIVMFIGIYLLHKYKIKFSLKSIIAIIIAVYVFFYTNNDSQWLNLLMSWMSNVMNRQVKISTRVSIWINAINAWLEHPIIGRGYLDEGNVEVWRILSLGNPHSSFLWILYEGGIIALILFLIYISICSKSNYRFLYDKVACVISASFIALLICMITDDHIFRDSFPLLLFALCYYIPTIIKEKQFLYGGQSSE
ncbi:MAG: O-antigen ligase family protein [Lachnospiraceae bacterium]|nr:O-antigen ligase family protein [Lachnospiraceae bacterium]